MVRDGLRLHTVVEELERYGVKGGIELPALGTAASRHHDTSDDAEARGGAAASAEAAVPDWARVAPPLSSESVADRAAEAEERAELSAARAARISAMRREANEARHARGGGRPQTPRRVAEQAAAERAAAEAAEAEEAEAVAAHEAAVEAAGARELRAGASRWRLVVAHESGVRGLDLPNLKLVR